MFLETNTFSVGQRKQLIIVHNRVHVLDPQRVNITVKHNILSLILIGWLVDLAENAR